MSNVDYENLLPTPTVADAFTDKLESSQIKDGSMHSVTLGKFVRMWPTPLATEAAKNPTGGLTRAVWATPTARDWKYGSQAQISRHHLNDQNGGQLNADWVEALMGFPVGWTIVEDGNVVFNGQPKGRKAEPRELKLSETPSSRKSRKISREK